MSAGLLEPAVRLVALVIPLSVTVCKPESSLIVTFAGPFNVGTGLPAVTVKRKLRTALALPSLRVIVIVELPAAIGVTCRVRASPLPPKVTFAFGTTVVLDELPERPRLLGTESISLTNNGSARVEPR